MLINSDPLGEWLPVKSGNRRQDERKTVMFLPAGITFVIEKYHRI